MTVYEIDYRPRRWARKLHSSFKRYFSLVIHRRGGKTTAIENHLQRAATDDAWEAQRMRTLVPNITDDELRGLMQDRLYGHIFPTYKQAKLVAWEPFKRFASPIPGIKINESELSIKYPNGGKVRLFGADDPDSLRGAAFWGLAFDEYSQQPPSIFSEVLSKSLADHLGFAIFGGTVKGKNQLYRTHEIAKANPNEWDYIWQDVDETLSSEDDITVRLIRQAIEDDRKMVSQGLMTQEEFDQEWYLSIEAAVKGAYYARELAEARKQKRIGVVPYDRALLAHTVWDLGVGTNMKVGIFQRHMGQLRLIDHVQGVESEGLPDVIAKVRNKPYVYGRHFAPHDIEATDVSTGKTRKETADALNFHFETVPMLSVADGIDAGKRAFSHLYVNETTCASWIDSIGAYHREWDENRGMFKEIPYHDWASHDADMWREAAIIEDRMDNEIIVATKVQIEQNRREAISTAREDAGL